MIIVNPEDSCERQRFTIAHELGHALFDESGMHERNTLLKEYRQKERRASQFAAGLIMPVEKVFEAILCGHGLFQMANIFGVSQTAMRIRLERLGII